MNALDYASSPRRSLSFAMVHDPRVRRAFIAAGAASIAIAATVGVESVRLDAAAGEVNDLTARLAALEIVVAPTRALARDVIAFDAIDARQHAVRASARATASEIAELGNRLPRDVWVTSLRVSAPSIALDGHSRRLAALATALTSLRSLPTREVRLVNVAADPVHGGVSYAIALRSGK